MSDKKDSKQDLTSDVLMADVMLRVTAIEKLLIDKGVITREELSATTDEIAKRIAKVVLEKVQASKNMEEFMKELDPSREKKDFNN